MRWLLYGAYGYTGRLIARRALRRGLEPILAGRDRTRLSELGRELGLEHRSFGLDDRGALESGLEGVDLVLSAAGPFSRTFEPLVAACLGRACHYLDITGEIAVFEAAFGLDSRARDAGVLVLPGVGLDVVPSDCAAVRAAERISGPTHLDLALHSTGSPSPGTLKSMLEGLARPGKVRRSGRLVDVPHGSIFRTIPFSDGDRTAACIPWGDVSTAYRSTGVPNVRVFMTLPPGGALGARILSWILRIPGALPVAMRMVEAAVPGPDPERRSSAVTRIWCEARNAAGRRARVELEAPGGYRYTAGSAVAAVERMAEGRVRAPAAGFQTPATAFGAGFVDETPGVRWIRE